MSEMIKAYQEINKRRQSNDMDVNSLTMFAEAWDRQQAKIDELQARIDKALHAADESCGVSVAAFVKLNNILKAVEK